VPDAPAPENWSPTSWSSRASNVGYAYDDAAQVESCVRQIARMPPLVTSGEVEKLIEEIAGAQRGERFLLQGGDCAETLEECRPDVVTSKLKILLQMSLVMVFAGRKPVIRVGRIAGQYAKPRSSANETRAGVSLPSYFGDLINRAPFTPEARRPDPRLMAEGYQHAAVTLNFVRSLMSAGFADIHHPEQWDLGFLRHAGLTSELRERYQALTRRLTESVNFMEAIGERDFGQLTSVRFYTSHEGLNLHYESAQTRSVPRKAGYWNLTTHMPWVGERTRALDGAHIEYFRGIRNPVGVKIGPSTTPAQVIALIEALNPANLAGKLVLIPRMGASRVREKLPALARAVVEARKTVLWGSRRATSRTF
jgi:3-deoxy-7-phosphoheptulonate synthase